MHALVAVSLITALLVLSDLFVQPGHLAHGTTCLQRGGRPGGPLPGRTSLDQVLPSCPACGLPVFAHSDAAPTRFSGLFWQRGPGAHVTLFPFVTGQIHANDDNAPDTAGFNATRFPASGNLWRLTAGPAGDSFAKAEATKVAPDISVAAGADRSLSVPEAVELDQGSSVSMLRARYAGSRLKTTLDVLGAGALLIALAPLMLAIAFLLAVSGGRPVLVHQERLDWSGGCFRVSRFRAASLGRFTAGELGKNQAVGGFTLQMAANLEAFLHRSGLASLPLLISVLRGDLSFVGPDPAMPKLSRRDRVGAAIVADFAARQGARPGLTCWAEVNSGGARGRAITARQKIAGDLYYLEHGSPLLDLRILLQAMDTLASEDRA
jgi:lipopolysaccharide/colanic/teichoic acid biosynthesis glycosyltransferase